MRKPHSVICCDDPFRGGLVIGRSGEARAVAVGQHVEGVQDLRVLGLLFADAGIHVVGALRNSKTQASEAAAISFFMSTRIAYGYTARDFNSPFEPYKSDPISFFKTRRVTLGHDVVAYSGASINSFSKLVRRICIK